MKKIVFIVIASMFMFASQANAQTTKHRRGAEFYIGQTRQADVSKKITEISSLSAKIQKRIDVLDRQMSKYKKYAGYEQLDSYKTKKQRKSYLLARMDKLSRFQDSLAMNMPQNKEYFTVSTKDITAATNAYAVVKSFSGNGQPNKTYIGLLQNFWNHPVTAVVTGPGGFRHEEYLPAGSASRPAQVKFKFFVPGNYRTTFQAAYSSRSVQKPAAMPGKTYSYKGVSYDYIARQNAAY